MKIKQKMKASVTLTESRIDMPSVTGMPRLCAIISFKPLFLRRIANKPDSFKSSSKGGWLTTRSNPSLKIGLYTTTRAPSED